LRPGELVTTGTLTEAMPAISGLTWAAKLAGIDLDGSPPAAAPID
jgi:hypothetical protein